MLESEKRMLVKCANTYVSDWKNRSVNELCNLYVENETNEILRQGYFSAIFLKKWGYIGKNYNTSKASGFTIEDCYEMVLDAVLYVLKKRMWLNPESDMFNDPCGPDKILNRVIYSRRQLWYYNANCDKRAANYGKSSLTEIEEKVGDHSDVFADGYSGGETDSANTNTRLLISHFFDSGKMLEGIILDSIVNDDCFTEKSYTYAFEDEDGYTHKTSRSSHAFKLSRLVSNIESFDEEKLKRLVVLYSADANKLGEAMSIIKSADKNKLNKIIKALIARMSNDRNIKEAVCC